MNLNRQIEELEFEIALAQLGFEALMAWLGCDEYLLGKYIDRKEEISAHHRARISEIFTEEFKRHYRIL